MFTWKQSGCEERPGALHRARAGWGVAPSGRERKQSGANPSIDESLQMTKHICACFTNNPIRND